MLCPAGRAVLPLPPAAEDIQALQSLLEATSNALIASHILHLMCHCFTRPDPPDMTPEQMHREWVEGGGGMGGLRPGGLHECMYGCICAQMSASLPPCRGGFAFVAL